MNRKSEAYKIQKGKDYISINKTIVMKYGLIDAYVLALLSYKQDSFGEWFFYDINELAEECNCSSPVIRKAMARLESEDMISVERSGFKGKLHYIVRAGVVSASLKEITKQNEKKSQNRNKRNHKTHINNKLINNQLKNNNDETESTLFHNDLQSMQSHGTAVGARTLFPSNDKNDEPSKKKKSNPLLKKIDSPFYKIIQWIISNENNKDLPFNKHRLPDEKNPNPTKLVVRCVEYLEQYARGEFEKNKLIDSNWKPYLQFSMSFDEVKRDVERAVTNFRTALNEAYLPVNKEFLKGMPLDAWFYNGNTQRSWFYELVHNPPKLKSEMLAEQIREQLPPVLDKVFGQFYMTNKSPKEELEYWQNLKTIYEKWKWLVSDMKYGDWYRNTQWLNYFRGLEQWCLTYFDFIKDFQHPLHILSIYSDTWKRYENYVWKEHKVELSPGDKTIEKLKIRQEEEMKETEEKRYKLMLSQASIAWKKNLEQFDAEDAVIEEDAKTEYLLSSYLYNCMQSGYTEKMYEYAKKFLPQAYEEDGSIKERFKEYDESVFMKQFCKKN